MENYEILTQEEQDEIVVSYLHSQERDEYCHEINLNRFNEMLATLPAGTRPRSVSVRCRALLQLPKSSCPAPNAFRRPNRSWRLRRPIRSQNKNYR